MSDTASEPSVEAALAEFQRSAREMMHVVIQDMLTSYAEFTRDWGVDAETVERTDDIVPDMLAMHRAMHRMSARVLAVADARPKLPN